MNIYIIDDHIYEFSTVSSTIKTSFDGPIHLIIQDLDIGDGCDLSKLGILRSTFPETPILIYTMHAESMYGLACLKYHISGYLTKDKPSQYLLDAIRTILSGGRYFSDTFQHLLISQYETPTAKHPQAILSQREYEVFILIGEGIRQKDIATQLHITAKTVATYRKEFLKNSNYPQRGS
jgi:two-component system invasion response regulator UvrY